MEDIWNRNLQYFVFGTLCSGTLMQKYQWQDGWMLYELACCISKHFQWRIVRTDCSKTKMVEHDRQHHRHLSFVIYFCVRCWAISIKLTDGWHSAPRTHTVLVRFLALNCVFLTLSLPYASTLNAVYSITSSLCSWTYVVTLLDPIHSRLHHHQWSKGRNTMTEWDNYSVSHPPKPVTRHNYSTQDEWLNLS